MGFEVFAKDKKTAKKTQSTTAKSAGKGFSVFATEATGKDKQPAKATMANLRKLEEKSGAYKPAPASPAKLKQIEERKEKPVFTDRYTGTSRPLQAAQSVLDVVNRLGQETADVLLMTPRTELGGQYTPVAPQAEKPLQIGGLLLGSAVPYGGIYKGLGALEATSQAAQRLSPLARVGTKGAIAGGSYETAYGAASGESPEEIAKRAAVGTVLGAAGDVGLTKAAQAIRAAREVGQLNKVRSLDLTKPEPLKQLPAARERVALPPGKSIAALPEGREGTALVGKPKVKKPAAPEAELRNARNVIANAKKPETKQRVLEIFPQLKKEFPDIAKQMKQAPKEKQPAKPAPPQPAEVKPQGVSDEVKTAIPKVKATTLRDIETQAGKAVNEAIEPAKPSAGMQVRVTTKGANVPEQEVPHRFSDPKVEERWNAANGVPKEEVFQRTKEGVSTLLRKATREFEHLPRTGEFSPIRYELSKLQKQRGVTSDRTLRLQQYILLDQDRATHDLFRRKVILDDLANTTGDLPFGFTQDTLKAELGKVDEVVSKNKLVKDAVEKRKQVWGAIKNEYVDAFGEIGFDMTERFNRKDYYRHQILEYANNKERRGFLKQRLGSGKDINTNYLQAEYEVMAQMLHDIEVAKAMKKISDKYNIRPKLEKQVPEDKTLSEIIPEGYVKWQPRKGSLFYLYDSIPFKVADRLYRKAMDELGLSEKELKRALTRSGHFDFWVVKEEIANTLDNMPKTVEVGVAEKALRAWKVWQLISPRRYPKYQLRNISGDADSMFAGNPSAFKKIPQATKELYQVFAGDRAMTPDMRDWFERGGMQTLLQAQELGDINKLKMFVNLMEKKGSLLEIPTKVWQGYWNAARMSTDFREAMLRYSSYLDYLGQMKKGGGKPRNFGASIPEEVMALDDIKDRAFKLSNELLGAYDQVSVVGQELRAKFMPFWSWNEVNFRRYKQLWLNAANDGELAHTLGRKMLTVVPKTPLAAYKVGKLAAKATALWIALEVWNNTKYPDLEAGLSKEEREKPHIILGKDKDGKTIYFGRLGALQDFVNWFGFDADNLQDVRDILNGKRSVKEVATEMVKEPVNKVVQGLTPFIKMPVEFGVGQKFFPDAFKPGQIRDRGLHFFNAFGLDNEYKAIAKLPSRPYGESLRSFLTYTQDPKQISYYSIIDEKYRFKEKLGKGGSGIFRSPKGDALYNFKLALRYDDKDAAKKYLLQYVALGGTGKGLQQSLKSLHPLYGLKKEEQIVFIRTLDVEQKRQLKQALQYYNEELIK